LLTCLLLQEYLPWPFWWLRKGITFFWPYFQSLLFLHKDIQCFQNHWLKKTILLCWIIFVSLLKISYVCVGLFPLSPLCNWFMCLFFHHYHTVVITASS
jgi:hypothetical protein